MLSTRSGRVRVRAKDKTGGKEAEIEIERKGGLDDRQLGAFTTLADDVPGRVKHRTAKSEVHRLPPSTFT